MPPISSEDRLRLILRKGLIFKIRGSQPFESDHYHHFVVVNQNPNTEDLIVLSVATHKVQEEVERVLAQGINDGTTIHVIKPGKYNFFPRQTAFNCNSPIPITFEQLVGIHARGDMQIPHDTYLDEDDLTAIINGLMASRQVAGYLKSLISN